MAQELREPLGKAARFEVPAAARRHGGHHAQVAVREFPLDRRARGRDNQR